MAEHVLSPDPRPSRRVGGRVLAVAVVVLVTVTGGVPPAGLASAAPVRPLAVEPDLGRSVPVTQFASKPAPAATMPGAATAEPPVLPRAESAVVNLPLSGSARVVVGGLPVSVKAVVDEDSFSGGGPGLSRVSVEVVEPKAAAGFGAPVALRVSRADGGKGGRVAVEIDYSAFAGVYGANWAWRLQAVGFADCVLSIQAAERCADPVVLPFVNDARAGRLSVEVDLDPAALQKRAPGDGEPVPAGSEPVGLAGQRRGLASAQRLVDPDLGSGLVIALMAGSVSDAGDFRRTDMKLSGEWAAGGMSGDFTYSYPIGVPPVPSGVAPTVVLGYSSGAVDGQTSGGNTQPGLFGEGWSYSPGFVERTYRSCNDDTANSPYWTSMNNKADSCWRLPNAQISLNGKVSEIVLGGDGTWRLANDDGEKVELLTGAGNGDNNGEHWRVTTVDGTQYWFGRHSMPDSKGVTNSVGTVPVFANHSGEPCFVSSSAGASWCGQGYRWMLDYVVDRHGNEIIYRYGRETNKTGKLGSASNTATYHRSIYLESIEYGTRAGVSGAAPARVVFTNSDRCFTSSCGTHDVVNWPDTPWDLDCSGSSCANNMTPSFWTTKRVSAITTQIRSSGSWTDVDSWALGQTVPAPPDGMVGVLWLESITRTGHTAGGTQALPSVSFVGTATQNRVDYNPSAGMASHFKFRITQVNTESGGRIDVTYSGNDTNCNFGGSFPTVYENNRRCYPQLYTNPSGSTGFAWWHKRVVDQVVTSDLVGGSPPTTYAYTYSTAGSSSAVLWSHHNGAAVWSMSTGKRSWSHWRGYSTVTVTTGDPSGVRSQVEYRYLRGLHGDRTSGGTRTVDVTAFDGSVWVDSEDRAGHLLHTLTYESAGGSSAYAIKTTPFTSTTGTRSLGTAWAIPDTQRSYLRRTAATARYERIDNAWSARTRVANTWHNTLGRIVSVRDDGSVPDASDTTCTRYTYADNTGAHMYSYVSRVQTAKGDCTTIPSIPADLLADSRTFYDYQAYGVAPTLGEATRTERYGDSGWVVTSKDVDYDAYGRITSTTDALDRTSTIAYTQTGDGLTSQISSTNPASHTITMVLDPSRGLPLTVTDANSKITTGTYDPLGRLLTVTRPGNTTGTPDQAYTYTLSKTDPSWVRSRVLGPNGNQIDSYDIYDGWLRLRQTQSTAPDGNRVVADTQYDHRGLTVKQSVFYNSNPPSSTLVSFADADVDRQTRTTYDGRGRATLSALWSQNTLQHSTTTLYEWDRVSTVPPAGGTTTMTVFDDLGRTVELRQYQGSSPTGPYTATSYDYNLRGELVAVTDPDNNQWTYTYDLLGRRTQTVDPDAGTSTTTYDDAGQITSNTDGNGTTLAYTYDTLGRRTAVHEGSTAGPIRASWAYDTLELGQLTSSTRHDNGLDYVTAVTGYDDGYRPLGTSVTIPASTQNGALAGTYTTNYTYKPNGALATLALPAIGGVPAETITYTYTNQGLPETTIGLDTYLAEALYRWDSSIAQTTHGTGTTRLRQTYTYREPTARLDTHGVLLENQTTPGTFDNAFTSSYSYDPAGNITSIAGTTNGNADRTECFTYDHLRQLTAAWTETSGCSSPQRSGADAYHRSWTFDQLGNRLTQTDHNSATGNTTWTYAVGTAASVAPHQLDQVTSTGPLAGPTREFTYNAAGQTITHTTPAGVAQTLTWDPEGHLATLTDTTGTSSYLYDADGNRLIARDPTTTTVYLGHTELAMPTGGGTITATRYYDCAIRTPAGLTWTITDHHATNTIQINPTTLTTQRTRRLPYGEDHATPPTQWFGTKGYIGGTQDPSGLTHLGAREYDPTLGRFISVDPIMDLTDPTQWHGYSYTGNSPITYSDPTGLCRYSDGGMCVEIGSPKLGQMLTRGGATDVTAGDILKASSSSATSPPTLGEFLDAFATHTSGGSVTSMGDLITQECYTPIPGLCDALIAEYGKLDLSLTLDCGAFGMKSCPAEPVAMWPADLWDHFEVALGGCYWLCINLGFQSGWLHVSIGGPGLPGGGIQVTFQSWSYEEQAALSLSGCVAGVVGPCADITLNSQTGEPGIGMGGGFGVGSFDLGVMLVVWQRNLRTGEEEWMPPPLPKKWVVLAEYTVGPAVRMMGCAWLNRLCRLL